MESHTSTPIEGMGRWEGAPTEPLIEYFVEFRYSGHGPVGTHYDTTVSVPPRVDKETVLDRAAEVVGSHVPNVRPSELEPAYTSTKAVSIGETQDIDVPGQPSRIELPEHIRYKHEDRLWEGKMFDVIADCPSSKMEAAVAATQAEGPESVEGTNHRILLSAITARLDTSTE